MNPFQENLQSEQRPFSWVANFKTLRRRTIEQAEPLLNRVLDLTLSSSSDVLQKCQRVRREIRSEFRGGGEPYRFNPVPSSSGNLITQVLTILPNYVFDFCFYFSCT